MKNDFWFGPDEADRRITYAKEFKAREAELSANGADTQRRIAAVYTYYRSQHGGDPTPRYSSGWRPKSVNEATAHAALSSNHLDANAGDVICDAEGHFAWWCFRNLWVLEQHGLWMEHPVATVTRAQREKKTPWCHLQRVPPHSGLRCYFPDTAALTEWQQLSEKPALAKTDDEEDSHA